MPHDLGATVRLTAECRDPGGTLTTATGVAVTVTLPDGATAAPAATETATGRYQADYTTVQAGRHTVRWQFTGPSAAVYTDVLDVREAVPPWILSLADARTHLNITTTAHDEELRGWIEATTAAVEWFVGPVAPRTVTEVHGDTVSSTVSLFQAPVVGLTALVPVRGGDAYDVAGYEVDTATGVVTRTDGGPIYGPLRVTYTAGRTVIPAAISAGARIILQHLWRTQQGPGRPQLGVGDFDVTEPVPGMGYAIPHRALQLLDPYRLPPAVA